MTVVDICTIVMFLIFPGCLVILRRDSDRRKQKREEEEERFAAAQRAEQDKKLREKQRKDRLRRLSNALFILHKFSVDWRDGSIYWDAEDLRKIRGILYLVSDALIPRDKDVSPELLDQIEIRIRELDYDDAGDQK